MFTEFWKIDLGTTLSIVIPIIGTAGLGVYRICQRLFKIEEQVADQGQRQEERFIEVGLKLSERNTLQDQRHAENKEAIATLQRILMERRPAR